MTVVGTVALHILYYFLNELLFICFGLNVLKKEDVKKDLSKCHTCEKRGFCPIYVFSSILSLFSIFGIVYLILRLYFTRKNNTCARNRIKDFTRPAGKYSPKKIQLVYYYFSYRRYFVRYKISSEKSFFFFFPLLFLFSSQ